MNDATDGLRLQNLQADVPGSGSATTAAGQEAEPSDNSAEVLAGRLQDCHDDIARTLGFDGGPPPAVPAQHGPQAAPRLLGAAPVQAFIQAGSGVVPTDFGDGGASHGGGRIL